jgi:hypothetical protein
MFVGRHAVLQGLIALFFVSGITFQLADIVTKALSPSESSPTLAVLEKPMP